jgi:hypothetical protein
VRRFLRENSLALITFGVFLVIFLGGQTGSGYRVYNGEQREHGEPTVSFGEYLATPHRNSLSLAFFTLFGLSLILHAWTGAHEHSAEQEAHGGEPVTFPEYVRTSQFWFESMQNWQSEFLAVGSIVVLTIWLRQQGSPESKPVHHPHTATGSS